MITGDNSLTAAYIGKELCFGPSEQTLFCNDGGLVGGKFIWTDVEEAE